MLMPGWQSHILTVVSLKKMLQMETCESLEIARIRSVETRPSQQPRRLSSPGSSTNPIDFQVGQSQKGTCSSREVRNVRAPSVA